jgi:repressor LexA
VPVISEQNIEQRVPVPREWIKSGSLFALRIVGDSMRDAGIIEGDEVIVRQTPAANDGEIVVATVDGETTIKRLRLRKRHATLFAENPAYRPIELTSDAVIQGVVVGLLRSYQKKPADGHKSSRGS